MSESSAIRDIVKKEQKDKSDLLQTSDLLMNEKYKRRKTILDNNQVPDITTVDTIAQIYDIAILKDWVDNYAEWRTSGDKGKGRQDIVDISKFAHAEQEKHNKELMDLLRNR